MSYVQASSVCPDSMTVTVACPETESPSSVNVRETCSVMASSAMEQFTDSVHVAPSDWVLQPLSVAMTLLATSASDSLSVAVRVEGRVSGGQRLEPPAATGALAAEGPA